MREKFDRLSNLCLCGSGKPYTDCCHRKTNPATSEAAFKQFMSKFDAKRKNFRCICLHPLQQGCSKVKTHAHTISERAVLSLISEHSEVLMPVMHGITNEFKMDRMGIEAKATKFYCFCQEHDSMFRLIDQRDVELNAHTYFLYAYRTFASTYYKVLRELWCYDEIVQEYDLTFNPLAILLYKQYRNWLIPLDRYKGQFNESICSNKYDCLEGVTIDLDYQTNFAAATCFCPQYDILGEKINHGDSDLSMMYISVIPGDRKTNLLFSWFKEDHDLYGFWREQIKIAPTRFVLKYLNNLLPLNCENMALNPLLWERWDDRGKGEFINVAHNNLNNEYSRNISKTYYEDRAYNLFERV